MATSSPLTPTGAVVLGLLSLLGPSTAYEMEQMVDSSLGHFWSFPRSQLYSEPTRLLAQGLVAEKREEAGRRRRTFRLTAAGRAALREWLAAPTTQGSEIRDLGLLRLFFGSAGSPEDVIANAVAQGEVHRQQLATYRELQQVDMDAHVLATLRLGVAYEKAAVAFWDSVAEGV
jgi:PadR family transcriptional regulator, regulatory protein AphA